MRGLERGLDVGPAREMGSLAHPTSMASRYAGEAMGKDNGLGDNIWILTPLTALMIPIFAVIGSSDNPAIAWVHGLTDLGEAVKRPDDPQTR